MRTDFFRPTLAAFALASCASPAPVVTTDTFDPVDPAVVAVLDSMVALAREGANAANADQALSALNAEADFTFMSGDLILTGKELIRDAFQETYADVHRQAYAPIGRQVRLIAPDIAIYSGIGRGTFQDKDGNISEPVHLGASGVFIRRDGQWRLVHFHQSIQP